VSNSATELLTYSNSTGDSTRRRYIRDGIAGNYDVVFEMVHLIRQGNKDYQVKNIAADILERRHLTSYANGTRILQAIFSYVTDKVDYIQDSAGAVESVKSAYRTLLDGYGDCDDLTITTATLAGVLGFEKTAIALAKYEKDDVTFSHVYTVVYYNDKRYVLDASLPNPVFNAEVKPFEVKEILKS
jgi:predicted transglutaminase-like cysteine proteinase